MVCTPRQRRDIQTRYVLKHSICFCIPRHRRDMSKAKGIDIISSSTEGRTYRIRALRNIFLKTRIYRICREANISSLSESESISTKRRRAWGLLPSKRRLIRYPVGRGLAPAENSGLSDAPPYNLTLNIQFKTSLQVFLATSLCE